MVQFGVIDVQFFKWCVLIQPDTGIAGRFFSKDLKSFDIDFFKIAYAALVAILQATIGCELALQRIFPFLA